MAGWCNLHPHSAVLARALRGPTHCFSSRSRTMDVPGAGDVWDSIVNFHFLRPPDQVSIADWLLGKGIAAYLTDRCTHKSRLFMLGNAVLLASTLFFFLGPAPSYILVARALQGASGAFLYVSGLAFLISRIEPDSLGTYMGYMTLATTMGELMGPIIGGSLYEHVGHWAVFGVAEGVIVVDMALRLLIREPKIPRPQGSDTSQYEAIPDEDGRWSHDEALSSTQNQSESETETAVALENMGSAKITTEGSAFIDYDEDGAGSVATLKDIRWNAVISVAFTTVTGIVRCALEATIPLYVFHRFAWNSALGGVVIFALLSPAVLGPWVGRFTTRHGPQRLSLYAFTMAGALLAALGILPLLRPLTSTSSSSFRVATEVLFVAAVFLIGVGVAVSTTAHMTAQSAFAQKGDELLARLAAAAARARDEEEEGGFGGGDRPKPLGWGLSWLTSGVLLAGNSTAWALGMFLGPLAADLLGFGSDAEWLRLCGFLAGLSWLAALGIGLGWRRNGDLFPREAA
ncbi:MFS amine transporter [Apiospora marii]|uniref:MFS amine transporter n=1 Tax=Apiospora marii TaxID=335849 RepID=A0ABR1SS84_9PEZI